MSLLCIFCTCKRQHLKAINTLARNWPSCIHHQANGYAHVDEGIKIIPQWLMLAKILQMRPQTQTCFFSSSSLTTLIVAIANVPTTRFNQSKHTIKRRTSTLTSYSDANRIAFPHPTKFSTMCNALKQGFDMIAILLWVCFASKDLRISKKGLITFITSSRIFLCKRQIVASNKSNISGPTKSSNSWASISIIRVMAIVKASDNN